MIVLNLHFATDVLSSTRELHAIAAVVISSFFHVVRSKSEEEQRGKKYTIQRFKLDSRGEECSHSAQKHLISNGANADETLSF